MSAIPRVREGLRVRALAAAAMVAASTALPTKLPSLRWSTAAPICSSVAADRVESSALTKLLIWRKLLMLLPPCGFMFSVVDGMVPSGMRWNPLYCMLSPAMPHRHMYVRLVWFGVKKHGTFTWHFAVPHYMDYICNI